MGHVLALRIATTLSHSQMNPWLPLLAAALPFLATAEDPPVMEKPGEHHAHLKAMAGTWDGKAKFHIAPGQTMEGSGVEIARLQPGGFWLISDFNGKFGDMDFHGHAVLGYEAHKKQYTGTWVDSFASVMMVYKGHCEKDGKVNVMNGTAYDPMKQREVSFKQVTEIVDANTKTLKMFAVEGEKETLFMETVYKRRAANPAPKTKAGKSAPKP